MNQTCPAKGPAFSYVDKVERLKTKATKVFCFIFYADFKISNFNERTGKILRQASWIGLALTTGIKKQKY
jgi:hypothetical protein